MFLECLNCHARGDELTATGNRPCDGDERCIEVLARRVNHPPMTKGANPEVVRTGQGSDRGQKRRVQRGARLACEVFLPLIFTCSLGLVGVKVRV